MAQKKTDQAVKFLTENLEFILEKPVEKLGFHTEEMSFDGGETTIHTVNISAEVPGGEVFLTIKKVFK